VSNPSGYTPSYHPFQWFLVGGFSPSEKMKVTWDDYSPYMEKIIFKKKTCSKPPTRFCVIINHPIPAFLHPDALVPASRASELGAAPVEPPDVLDTGMADTAAGRCIG